MRPRRLSCRGGRPLNFTVRCTMTQRLASLLVFACIVAVFLYDRLTGIRVLGFLELAFGLYVIRVGKVPYGWRGFPPSGYLTGWAATACGVFLICLGTFFLVTPTAVEPLFCGRRGCP